MTPIFRILLICVSIMTTCMIVKKIRDAKVQIEESVFWVFFSVLLIILSVFPGAAEFLSDLVGTYSTSNFIFLVIIFILLVKVFYMSIQMSQLETKIKELVQRMALDENRLREDALEEAQIKQAEEEEEER